MEFLVIALVIVGLFVVLFLLFLGAGAVGRRRGRREVDAFRSYLAGQRPDLPAPVEMLLASRQSMGRPDTALVVAGPQRELLVLLDDGKAGIHHVTYPFDAFTGASSTDRMISRGLPTQRVYSFEQTLTVTFADGRSYPFTLEMVSNRAGSDGAPSKVAALFAPWQERLNEVLASRAAAASTAAPAPVPPPPPGTPAGWYADPVDRHEQRWWDGTTWTSAVADHGSQGNDPVAVR